MQVVTDLHIHSKYSRAVSSKMTLNGLADWADRKGIDLVASGDWTHPIWIREIKSKLEQTSKGIYGLKKSENKAQFLLSTEISSIYSEGNKTRKIHNLVWVPSIETAEKTNEELLKQGANLMSDGRPIIGLSAKELAELIWSVDKKSIIIPAHIWTPWFAMFGSKSGFDSLKECWGDYADKIYAVETGLSSDPEMNWRVSDLDNCSLVSFSDAHSPSKLGRELTIFELDDLSFENISKAINKNINDEKNKIVSTIEFYPEEGKYHLSGHRKCDITFSSKDIEKRGTTCPVCGKTLTLGVVYRVNELADQGVEIIKKKNEDGLMQYFNKNVQERAPFVKLVPLAEILSQVLDVGVNTKTVKTEYDKLINKIGPELKILTKSKIKDIAQVSGKKIGNAIKKVREGEIFVKPGFDGVFGKVKIWADEEEKDQEEQMFMFS